MSSIAVTPPVPIGAPPRRSRPHLAALGLYLLAAALLLIVLIQRGAWPGSRFYVGTAHDETVFIWYLVWWPYAVARGLDPFTTHFMWAPTGISLAWEPSIPGPSLLAAPLTAAIGPVATYNTLALLAPVLSAFTAYLLCWRITRAFWPALVGGYFFGFSSYTFGQLLGGHPNLFLTFLVPLCVLLVFEHHAGRLSRLAVTIGLGISLVFQFAISTEVFATLTVFGSLAGLIAYVLRPDDHRRIERTAGSVLVAYGLALALLFPLLAHMAGGEMTGAPFRPLGAYSTDLLNWVLPTPVNWFGGRPWPFTSANYYEAAGYLGIPVWVILWRFARLRRTAAARGLLWWIGVVCLASLGPRLYLLGRPTSVPLPWEVVEHIPLLRQALPARFMLYAALGVSVAITLWLVEPSESRRTKWLLGTMAVVLLIPNPWLPWRTPIPRPPFFTQGLYRQYLSPDETVLVLPFGTHGMSMIWQAESGMAFRIVGGVTVATPADPLARGPVIKVLAIGDPPPPDYWGRNIPDPVRRKMEAAISAFLTANLRNFVAANRVHAIVDADNRSWIGPAVGVPAVSVGGVALYRVP